MTNEQVYYSIETRTQAQFTAQRLRFEAIYEDLQEYVNSAAETGEHLDAAEMLLLELELTAHSMGDTLQTLQTLAASKAKTL